MLTWSAVTPCSSAADPMPDAQPYHGINFEREIELEERIGSGAFGSVYRGRWQGAPVAVKIMQNVGSGAGSDIVESFTQEVKASR